MHISTARGTRHGISSVRQFFADERGATSVQYAVMLTLIVLVVSLNVGNLGMYVSALFDSAATAIETSNDGGGGDGGGDDGSGDDGGGGNANAH